MAVAWRVTGQLDNQYSNDGSGTPVLGHVVSFLTGNGDRGSVFLPEDRFNETNVRTAITAKAAIIDAVAKAHHDG
jgi:hypothetical protein